MVRSFAVAFLACALLAVPLTGAQSRQPAETGALAETVGPTGGLPALPPLPGGTSTTMGGTIQSLDQVRDQFSLAVYGQRPIKILFDERTQVYRDGVKVPLHDLRPEEHASVQTALDGSNLFAVSVHILSAIPEGECQGRVQNYNARTGELAISTALSPEPIKLIVPAEASITRQGQSTFASQSSGRNDLLPGALVTATFRHGQNSKDVANQITILAVPCSSFVFAGTISYLDLSAGVLAVANPQDGKTYEVHFSSTHIPSSGKISVGESVSVKAIYDGSKYQAAEITAH